MRESPPKTCTGCRYDFTGLPPAHRCPECGFEYDEQTVVWRPTRQWRPLPLLILPAVSLLMPLVTVWKLLGGRQVDAFELFGTLAIVILWGTITFTAVRQIRRGRLVAINPAGICGRAHMRDIVAPWSEFVDAQFEHFGVRINRRQKLLPASVFFVFDHAHGIADFREAIASALERRASRESRSAL